jgi:nitrite reductase (NADH) small subunit
VWTAVCLVDDLVPERGAAAIVGGEQLALFRLADGRVVAVQQHDPFSDAYVLSRGLVGTRTVDGAPVATVASPMYKQVFDLVTGRCLEAVGKSPVRGGAPDLRTYPVRVEGGMVQVAVGAVARDGVGA